MAGNPWSAGRAQYGTLVTMDSVETEYHQGDVLILVLLDQRSDRFRSAPGENA